MTDCMCRGCNAGSGASLHYIPRDPEIRKKWMDFIYKNRAAPKFKNVDRVRICSAHFTEECFTNYRQKMMGFGKRLILKPNAIPTLAAQLDFPAPRRTRQEKVDETLSEARLCPLCQRHQKDTDTLSFHLTKKHSVHPACLDNLLITAPYADRPGGEVTVFSAQTINGTSEQKSSENTRSPLIASQQDSSQGCSKENDASDELVIENRGNGYGDTEASVKVENSEDKYNAAADGNVKRLFKCRTCLEFFPNRSELSVHCKSDTHIQKMRTGIRIDCDTSNRILAYPDVSSKPYQCDVCHVSYLYAFGLESHLKSVLHQSRSRKAGRTATITKKNKKTAIAVVNLAGTTVANATQLASAKTCDSLTQTEKVQVQPASSLLPTPVVSAQGVPTVLPLLTLSSNSVPHTIVPSAFPPPGASTSQLIPQPQMLISLIVNRPTPDGTQQILQQTVPVIGLSSAKQARDLGSSDTQGQSSATEVPSASRIPFEMNTPVDGVGMNVKIEIKEEPCEQEVSQMTPCMADAICQVGLKQEYTSMLDGTEDRIVHGNKQQCKAKGVSEGKNSKRQCSDANKASTTQDLHNSHVNKSSPAKCNPSHVLMPSSTKVCSSLSSGPPILTEFQSQVLWAFFESRNEADSAIPPREDCEALGRVVGLGEDEVRKWLLDTHCAKLRHHANVQSHYERHGSREDDEDALVIDESGATVRCSGRDFLSHEEDLNDNQAKVNKKRKRSMAKDDSEDKKREAEY